MIWSDETLSFWISLPLTVPAESGDIVPNPQDATEAIRWRSLPTELNALLARVQPGQWDDLQGDVVQAAAVGALTMQAYRDTSFIRAFFRHDQNDTISQAYQLPHGWNMSEVRLHLHVTPCAASDGIAVFSGSYYWDYVGELLGADVSWTDFRVDFPITAAMQYRQQIVPLFSSTPPELAMNPSAILNVVLSRLGTDPADTYTGNNPNGTAAANISLRNQDLHFQYATLGTLNEFSH